MASGTSNTVFPSNIEDIIRLVWGPEVKEEIFQRWKQGFKFSDDEPTALVQEKGGPCAVLAPVQAFILKSVIASDSKNWREMEIDVANRILVYALCEILSQVGSSKLIIIELASRNNSTNSPNTDNPPDDRPLDHNYFHSRLRIVSFESIEEVKAFYLENINMLKDSFGVLLFLYSVLCTKGLERLLCEVGDGGEPLIESEFGYGCQSLINLMITGSAVAHVWNYEQDVGGLKLRGIDKQSTVGFLTLLEHLRYCEVGSFLKNPMDPVWVLASDTHLTVLFSFEKGLVSAETPSEMARRVFKSFDPDGNNFIQSNNLEEVLKRLQLVSEPREYVEIMRKKLDSENLGIILLPAFMDEFFPDERVSSLDLFTLFHYNGIEKSCHERKVKYQEGQACLLESHVTAVLDSNPMLTCLQTKWPTIDIRWLSGVTPSLN